MFLYIYFRHIYHYYIHGPSGNQSGDSSTPPEFSNLDIKVHYLMFCKSVMRVNVSCQYKLASLSVSDGVEGCKSLSSRTVPSRKNSPNLL